VGCYIWYGEDGTGRAGAPPSPVLAVPNVTAHPSTASVPTSYYSMLYYNQLIPFSLKKVIILLQQSIFRRFAVKYYHIFLLKMVSVDICWFRGVILSPYVMSMSMSSTVLSIPHRSSRGLSASMEQARRNGNVHLRTSHMMMMMILSPCNCSWTSMEVFNVNYQ